ncbi:MAG: hypothetical protein ACUVR2_07955 [Anaerolineae bacterium]
MQLYWLSLIPLLGAGIVVMTQRWRGLVVGLSFATMLTCARLACTLPLNEGGSFLRQSWNLDQSTQMLLLFVYGMTMILLAIAATIEQATSFYAPILASVGLLSAVVLLRSWISFLLLPAALVVPVLATPPALPPTARGASYFLIWATIPVPFILVIFILLERFALFPDEMLLMRWNTWLVVPPFVLWLTLFPLHWTTPLWANSNPPLAPTFLWTVKDWIIFYLFLALWQQNPVLHTESVLTMLNNLGLLTTVFSGVWAVVQTSPSAVLGCAAMSALGVAVQSMAMGSSEGLLNAMSWLVHRSAAVLLATSALAAMSSPADKDKEEVNAKSFPWLRLALSIIFVIGVLDLASIPLISRGLLGYQQMDAVLQEKQSRVMQALWISSAGIVIGLIRASWQLWHARVRVSAGHIRLLSFLRVICILLLVLWMKLSPSSILGWISVIVASFSPL